MAQNRFSRRLLGSDLNSSLWRLLALCLLGGLCVPGLRELTRMIVAPGPVVRLLNGDERATAAAAKRAKAIGQPWAMLGLAERGGAPERNNRLAKAAAMAPNDETIAIRRAIGLALRPTAPEVPAPHSQIDEHLGQAARHAIAIAPDNAVGWYLLAASQVRQGQRAAALESVSRGNAAARCDDHSREAYSAAAQLSQAAGTPAFESWFLCMSTLTYNHLSAYREVARGLMQPGASLADRLVVAGMGARLCDESNTLITLLVGQAVEQYAFAGPAGLNAKHPSTETKEQQSARRNQMAKAFAAELRQAGQAPAAAWVEAQQARSEAARQAIATHRHTVIIGRALDPHLAAYGAWSAWAGVTTLAALSLLLWAACARRVAGAAPMAWRSRDLLTLWCASLLPFALISGLLSQNVATLTIARLFGVGSDAPRPAPLWPLLASALLPLVCSLGLLRAVGSAYRRRHPESLPMSASTFDRSAARSLLMPTAALLLLCSWAALWPCVYHRQTMVSYLRTHGFDETTAVRAAMDEVRPAGAPPASVTAD